VGGQPANTTTVQRLRISSVVSSTVVRATVLEQAVPAKYRAAATKAWGFLRWSFTGLSRMDYCYVQWVSDGMPCAYGNGGSANGMPVPLPTGGGGTGEFSLANGEKGGCITTIGLEVVYELETLDLPAEKAKQKLCTRVGFEARTSAKTATVWLGEHLTTSALSTPPTLVHVPPRTLPQHQGPFSLDVLELVAPAVSAWGKNGRQGLRFREALPIQVLSLIREVEVTSGA